MSKPAEILVNLFSFIKNEGKGDLDPDNYQLAFRPKGFGLVLVIKYLIPNPDKERELGTIGLGIDL